MATSTIVKTSHLDIQVVVEVDLGSEIIRCTTEHPFWTSSRGWVEAASLSADDELIDAEGTEVPVREIRVITLDAGVRVYNITVNTVGTFHIGVGGYLVHNKAG